MFYLFEIACKVKDRLGIGYEIIQVIARDSDEAKNTIINIYGYGSNFEFKLLKITPISDPFIPYITTISDQTYQQFECIEKENRVSRLTEK